MNLQYLKGVGPKLAKVLKKLNLATVLDLLYYLPRDYEDRTKIKPIKQLVAGQPEIIKAKIDDVRHKLTRNYFSVLKVLLSDSSGRVEAVFFNQPYLAKLFRPGMSLVLSGKLLFSNYEKGLQFVVKSFEVDTGENVRFVPVYNLTEGLYPKKLRTIIKTAMDNYLSMVQETLPQSLLKKLKLIGLKQALQAAHFPDSLEEAETARRRLVLEELLVFQLGLLLRKDNKLKEKGIVITIDKSKIDQYIAALPFELTKAQQRVLNEIFNDLLAPHPMGRLLQGDVGSGKTIVAAIASLAVISSGHQVALMAPTEILAQQHFEKIKQLMENQGVKVGLLTSATSKTPDLSADFIIGTHALIQDKVKFERLGLVIIDEQHRFGVEQRANLSKKGINPHLLVMTATPIPRSLALTLYGDLDRSIINELPKGRIAIKTSYVPESKRQSAYAFIRQKIKAGQQVYVVCPLIEESEKIDLKAAKDIQIKLQKEIFSEYKVALLHGRMLSKEKEQVMNDFKNNSVQVLVSTSVIEVGIDVPNASIMVIEHAERFGLSNLHQLRGRIGRGTDQSFCFLMADPKSADAKERISAMLETNDGFIIAEKDLKIRGFGDIYGLRQSGLPNFRVADIIRDENILIETRKIASELVAEDINSARNIWESQRQKIESPAAGKALN